MLGEWKLPHVQNKIKKINRVLKLCTLATNQLIAENPKSSKHTCDLYRVTITYSCPEPAPIIYPMHFSKCHAHLPLLSPFLFQYLPL